LQQQSILSSCIGAFLLSVSNGVIGNSDVTFSMDNYMITMINSRSDVYTYGILQTPLFGVNVDHIKNRYTDKVFER